MSPNPVMEERLSRLVALPVDRRCTVRRLPHISYMMNLESDLERTGQSARNPPVPLHNQVTTLPHIVTPLERALTLLENR